jgi:peroxiredoxin/mono/diheme cytochrome c family protein
MRNRVIIFFGVFCTLPFLSTSFLYCSRSDVNGVGRKVGQFTLPDTSGRAVSLAQFKDKKAVVVIFMGTECPINNALMPRLVEMQKHYAPLGVQFLGINSNQQDTAERVAEHARQNGLNFPALKDEGNAVADQFGAERTPEAFLLDAERTIRYRGRIDDQFGIGYKRLQPTQRDLATALDELLAGKPISRPITPVAGCIISRVSPAHRATAGGEAPITYANQVARIMQARCQECHRPGEVGPMSLLTYDDTVAWADTIREVLLDKRMPPWHADQRYGHFSNDRSLTKAEHDTLLAWLDQGMAKGNDQDMPRPRQFVAGWTIGTPDMVFEMPQEYQVPAEAPKEGVPYQRFRVPTNFTEDRWIDRAEARAGARSVVHHVIVWIVAHGEQFRADNPELQLLCGTAPGDMPQILPPRMGKKIPAKSDLIFEIHYTPNGTPQKDRSVVGVIFAKQKPRYEVRSRPIPNDDFKIPAGAADFKVEQSFRFPQDSYLLGFMPHMHMRGKDFLYEVAYPNGKNEILLSVPRYDFNWQSVYRVAEPLFMPKGSKIHCLAHFDNSANNPSNPDPTVDVTWGDQTWEEMMIGWIDYATERK